MLARVISQHPFTERHEIPDCTNDVGTNDPQCTTRLKDKPWSVTTPNSGLTMVSHLCYVAYIVSRLCGLGHICSGFTVQS